MVITDYESLAEFAPEFPVPAKAPPVPAGRCTPRGKRVGKLTCGTPELAAVRAFLKRPTITGPTLRAAIEGAAARAVLLARHSAAALDSSARTTRTRRLFCEAFGVAPEFVPPWRAGLSGVVRWRDLGELVAIRLRDVARILDGGCIHYFCWGSQAHCPECPGAPTYFACSSFLNRYVICLGQGFWRAWQSGDTATTASTLLHEALHIYFGRTVSDRGRSGNANCYERFTVRLHSLPLHPATSGNCPGGVCASVRVAEAAPEFEDELELEEEAELELLAPSAPHRPSPIYRSHSSGNAWVGRLVPLLNLHRGKIPLEFLLGWIEVESGGIIGRPGEVSSLGERGYFQIHPDEWRDYGFSRKFPGRTMKDLSTDPDFSVRAGIELVRVNRLAITSALRKFGFNPGPDLFWHLVKLRHWSPVGINATLLHMKQNGFHPLNWDAFRAYMCANRMGIMQTMRKLAPKLLRPDFPERCEQNARCGLNPKKGIENVEKLFKRGPELIGMPSGPMYACR
jgi:hypothetical protein